MSGRIVAKAPGKLYIAGEYAVVEPGHAAIIVAVDRYITVTLEEAADQGAVRSAGEAYSTVYWRHEGGHPVFRDAGTDYVSQAISVVEELREERGLPARYYNLDLTSTLEGADGRKFGLGSSGAVTVAIIEAVSRFYELNLTKLERYKLAVLAIIARAPQSSGGDVAASTYGGWILYRSPDRARLVAERPAHTITELFESEAWAPLEISPLPAPKGERLIVGWTGSPASTEKLVSGVKSRSRGSYFPGFLAASDAMVMALAEALRTERHAHAAVARGRRLLQKLGDRSGIRIETPRLARLNDIVEAVGGAGKSSGAGGGDCGIAIIDDDTDLDRIYREWMEQGIVPLDLHVTVRPEDAE